MKLHGGFIKAESCMKKLIDIIVNSILLLASEKIMPTEL
jgi:hypothetical protein